MPRHLHPAETNAVYSIPTAPKVVPVHRISAAHRLRTKSGLNEHLVRHLSETGPYCISQGFSSEDASRDLGQNREGVVEPGFAAGHKLARPPPPFFHENGFRQIRVE